MLLNALLEMRLITKDLRLFQFVLADLFLGIYYNLSVWYKVSEKLDSSLFVCDGCPYHRHFKHLTNLHVLCRLCMGHTYMLYFYVYYVIFVWSPPHHIYYNWKYISFYIISALSYFIFGHFARQSFHHE